MTHILRSALTRHIAYSVIVALCDCLAMGDVAAQGAFPNKPLRIIVPFAPGSGSDTYARFVAVPLSKALGQPVIVENRPGADGAIGTQEVLHSAPDGYTILLGSNSTLVVNPLTNKDLAYKPQDFRPISGLVRAPAVVVTSQNSAFSSIADVVAESKKRPGELAFASYAPALRMAVTWLESLAAIKVNHINYKGASQLMTDLVGAHLNVAMVDVTASIALIKSNKIRALAVAGAERHQAMPNVPTMQEAGYPGFVHTSWIGIYVPSKAPEEVVHKLDQALGGITASAEFRPFVEQGGGSPMTYNAAQMRDWLAAEIERYQKLMKAAGML